MDTNLTSLIDHRSDQAAALLARLISFPSTAGNEREIQEFLAEYTGELGFEPRLVPIYRNIESDADYTPVPNHKGYHDRRNLVLAVEGKGGGRSIILNTHVDVVPGPDELFQPRIENGTVYGRGAVDAKGHVVTILLALSALKDTGIRLSGDVIVQFVIEEEAGGNGALSVILDGMRADGVIVMESTDFCIHPAGRGAVWFKLTIEGKSTHMGRWKDGVNAIEKMVGAIHILQDYEQELLAQSGNDPLFPDPAANVKVNFGQIQGGEWPSMVAGKCVLEGGIGFLPNKRLAEIREEVQQALESRADEWTRQHYSLDFSRLHNEAYRMDPDDAIVKTLAESVKTCGLIPNITGMTASCDARLFWHRGRMPTVVFGPGKFPYAHALDEQISIADITTGAKILADFLIRWCQ